jgi:hypothetical protein
MMKPRLRRNNIPKVLKLLEVGHMHTRNLRKPLDSVITTARMAGVLGKESLLQPEVLLCQISYCFQSLNA